MIDEDSKAYFRLLNKQLENLVDEFVLSGHDNPALRARVSALRWDLHEWINTHDWTVDQ